MDCDKKEGRNSASRFLIYFIVILVTATVILV